MKGKGVLVLLSLAVFMVWGNAGQGVWPAGKALEAANPAGNYIVTEITPGNLSEVTPSGIKTAIYNFGIAFGGPQGVAVDGAGNYIVAESALATELESSSLSMVTPGGVRTIIYPGSLYSYYGDVAIDGAGNYIVTEAGILSKITPGGIRTVIYNYGASGIWPRGVAIDGAGDYIVTEEWDNKLSKITPSGVRTVIYNFATNTWPLGVAIDGAGNYIVTECLAQKLSQITPGGVRTEIYSFAANTDPWGVAIDSAGNYVVVESYAKMLSKITPGGFRTLIHSFAAGVNPRDVAIVPGATIGYDATIWGWDYILGWIPEPITMDGVSTGYSTPHTFTNLTGTHAFTVPSTDSAGRPFSDWDTGWTDRTITVSGSGTYTARYRAGYSATIWSWCATDAWLSSPISMDGVSTGYSTPHTFADLTGTHTFTVPSTDSEGHPFSDWDTGWTAQTITVSEAGTYTARYRAGYSATIWGWDYIQGWPPAPITMDGVSTGYSTPHTFNGLNGTHTFTVPNTNSAGHPFSDWSTDWTDPTITVSEAGVYTARYRAGYSATIWSWCAIDGWLSSPITMDGVSTGYSTPHTFAGLNGSHTFTVAGSHAGSHRFYEWSTGSTSVTLTVSSAGVYTARHKPVTALTVDFNGDSKADILWRITRQASCSCG